VRYKGQVPALNTRVKVEGMNRKGRVYISDLETERAPSPEIAIEGVFKGASEDGKVWNVGGIAVEVTEGSVPPKTGDEVRLHGTTQQGKVNVAEKETRETGDLGVEIEGKLSSVDSKAGTISVRKSGSVYTVNISGASLRTDKKQALSIADLRRYTGEDVEVEGLRKKDGILTATVVVVDAIEDEDHGGDDRDDDRERRDND
jgi:hypothetical protein